MRAQGTALRAAAVESALRRWALSAALRATAVMAAFRSGRSGRWMRAQGTALRAAAVESALRRWALSAALRATAAMTAFRSGRTGRWMHAQGTALRAAAVMAAFRLARTGQWMHTQGIALPAALLAAAGASGWMLYNLDFDAPVTPPRSSDAPDAWMENFVTVEMDGAGEPKRRIEADYMAYLADETIEFVNPHYMLFRAEGEPWHVRSERGQVSADGTVVLLPGKVDIWRNDASGVRDLDIRTEHLKVLPDSEYGETAEPVTIRTHTSISTGVGMRAYLDETRFQLLSQVRTHVDGHRPRR